MTISVTMIKDFLLVLLGGGIGSLFRYLVSVFVNHKTSSPFPYKTLLVNVIGCFLIGYLSMRIQNNHHLSSLKLFFVTGFLGGFTTFSTFSYETILLYQNGHTRTAFLNIALSTVAGLIAVLFGMYLNLKS